MSDLDRGHFGDLVITTASGSYWYYSTGYGTWNEGAYSRGDWKL